MYDIFWGLIPGFDRSEVKKNCLKFSHAIFGCFPYQLVAVFSTRTVSRSKIFRKRTIIVEMEMFENLFHMASSSPLNQRW